MELKPLCNMVPLSSGSGLQSCMLQSSLSTPQSLDWLLHCLILNLVPPPHEAVHSLHSDHSSVVLRFAAGQHNMCIGGNSVCVCVCVCVYVYMFVCACMCICGRFNVCVIVVEWMDWDLQTYKKYFCWNASIIEDVSFLLLGHKPH